MEIHSCNSEVIAKLEAENLRLTERVKRYREALEQIVKMEGPYRIDHHEHAKEVIAFNQKIAKQALAESGEGAKP